jgi:uncharacterized protein (DUF697 family)
VGGLPFSLGTLRALQKELTVSAGARKPLIVGGARSLVPALRRELGISGNDDPRGAAVYVHIWAGDGTDEAALKRARRARTPIVALAPQEVDDVPYVLATDVVPLLPGAGFPMEALAGRIAGRLGEEAAPLAARLPVLRRAVAEQLIAGFARKNAIVAVAVFVPGADLPILVRNQIRMLLRLEQAYGRDPDPRERVPELLGTLAAGVGFRAVARELLDLVPPDDAEGIVGVLAGRRRPGRRRFQRIAGWAVQGAVAYAGTRALGEAAVRRLEMTQRSH